MIVKGALYRRAVVPFENAANCSRGVRQTQCSTRVKFAVNNMFILCNWCTTNYLLRVCQDVADRWESPDFNMLRAHAKSEKYSTAESRSERLDKVNATVNNKNLIAIIQYVPEGTISPMGKVTTVVFLLFSLYCLFTSILCLVGTRANDRPQFLGD